MRSLALRHPDLALVISWVVILAAGVAALFGWLGALALVVVMATALVALLALAVLA